MANMTATDVNVGSVILSDARFEDGLLTFGGAGTVKMGTILARDSVSNKFVPFVKGGSTNGNGIPKAVLTYDVTATGAGDITIRAGIAGEYRKERLIIAADGTDANVDFVVRDQMRDYGLVPFNVKELGATDNQ